MTAGTVRGGFVGKVDTEVTGRRWKLPHSALLILSVPAETTAERKFLQVCGLGATPQAQPFRSCPGMVLAEEGGRRFSFSLRRPSAMVLLSRGPSPPKGRADSPPQAQT